jgi:hypothetical protein
MSADRTAEYDGNPSASVSACYMCGHRAIWHHDDRGCQYHGNGQNRCACRRSSDQVVARLIHDAIAAASRPYLDASVTRFPEKPVLPAGKTTSGEGGEPS